MLKADKKNTETKRENVQAAAGVSHKTVMEDH